MPTTQKISETMRTNEGNSQQDSFDLLQKRYGIQHPSQIKERIMWNHLKSVVRSLYGESAQNTAQLLKFEQEWNMCEQEETTIETNCRISIGEFESRATDHLADIDVSQLERRIHPSIKTPEQLMMYSIFEMQKQIVFMLAKTDENIREYATSNALFKCALDKLIDREE